MTRATKNREADRLDGLTELLRNTLGEAVSTDEVAQCLTTAMAQLQGSVHPHDLPEMAYQLAKIRLSARSRMRRAVQTKSLPRSSE